MIFAMATIADLEVFHRSLQIIPRSFKLLFVYDFCKPPWLFSLAPHAELGRNYLFIFMLMIYLL